MRKALWIMLAVMVVAVTAPNAHADAFTYDFTSTTSASPSPGSTGSAKFTESSILTSATTITSFTSDTFSDLVSLLLAPESGESCSPFGAPAPCIAVSTGDGVTSFYYFSSNLTSTGTYDANSSGNQGTLVISEVSTAPEPSSVALMLLGVGLLFVMRKRGHQLAT